MTIKELLNKQVSLSKILTKHLPFKAAYRMRKIADKILQEMKQVDKIREEMIKKYGTKNEEGQISVTEPKQIKLYNDTWLEFVKEEIEIKIEKIPFECLDGIELSAMDVANVFEFIAEEVVEPKKTNKEG